MQAALEFDQPLGSVLGEQAPKRRSDIEARVREIGGKPRKGNDARQRGCRPQDGARAGVILECREIARPSAARTRRVRRR